MASVHLPNLVIQNGTIIWTTEPPAPDNDYSRITEFAMGEVYGLRTWRVDEYGRLRARNIDQARPWKPGENTAICEVKLEHSVPHEDCRCGFYAYTDLKYAKEECLSYTNLQLVTGVIKAYGRVLIGTKGFRAEKAEIVALRRPKKDSRLADRLGVMYPDVPQLNNKRELLDFAPISDTLPSPDSCGFWDLP